MRYFATKWRRVNESTNTGTLLVAKNKRLRTGIITESRRVQKK